MKTYWYTLMVMAALVATGAVGAEALPAPAAPVDPPAPDAGGGLSHWILGVELVWKGLAAAGTFLLTLLFRHSLNKAARTDAEKEAVAAVEQAVVQVYHNYVAALKDRAQDGKLTREEAREARVMAVREAMQLAKGPALAVLKEWGEARVQAVVERVVAKFKAKATPAA